MPGAHAAVFSALMLASRRGMSGSAAQLKAMMTIR
jgi:hypothetical protein